VFFLAWILWLCCLLWFVAVVVVVVAAWGLKEASGEGGVHVVEDVIENVRADFQSDGVDDAVLIELQAVCLLLSLLPFSLLLSPSALWEKKHVPQLTWGSA
jgi:hypothetical protein